MKLCTLTWQIKGIEAVQINHQQCSRAEEHDASAAGAARSGEAASANSTKLNVSSVQSTLQETCCITKPRVLRTNMAALCVVLLAEGAFSGSWQKV